MNIKKRKSKRQLIVVGLFLVLIFQLIVSTQITEGTTLGPTHIGTFDGETIFQLTSESGILPTLELDVENRKGEMKTYESSHGVLTLSDTIEGNSVKRAILKGQTIVNLFDMDYFMSLTDVPHVNYLPPKIYSRDGDFLIIKGRVRYEKDHAVFDKLTDGTEYTVICENKDVVIHVHDDTATSPISKKGKGSLSFTAGKKVRIGFYNEEYEVTNESLKTRVMIVEGDYENVEIPYFKNEEIVSIPTLIITNEDGTKSSRLNLGEDVTLQSKGKISDELDLLTGKLTQRIGEDGDVLSKEIVKTVELNSTYQFPPQIQVTGKITPVITSITVPSEELTFTLDPNQEVGRQFIAPEFEVTNGSNAPLSLTLKAFEQTSTIFNDVLPSKHDSWEGLTKEESKDFALGLVSKPSTDWLNRVEKTHYVSNTSNNLIGTIKPKGTVQFGFEAHHGQSFSEPLSPSYRVTLVFDLLN